MPGVRWTWDSQGHPNVAGILAARILDLEWCSRLETAPADSTVGKVLCVCAAAAIAREVLAADGEATPRADESLTVLSSWIDEPTDDRFESICSLIFGEGDGLNFGPHGIVWWAMRTATSFVGNYEAGWALSSGCSAAASAGFSLEQLRGIAERELLSRMRQVG